jgi:hypothetical protein
MNEPEPCNGRLDDLNEMRTYDCTLPFGHEETTHEPFNHEAWADGNLIAEWTDGSDGAWRQPNG